MQLRPQRAPLRPLSEGALSRPDAPFAAGSSPAGSRLPGPFRAFPCLPEMSIFIHFIILVVLTPRIGVNTRLDWPEYEDRQDIAALFDQLDAVTERLSWHKVNSGVESPLSLWAPFHEWRAAPDQNSSRHLAW